MRILQNSETLTSIIESIVFVSGNAIAAKDIAEKLDVTTKQVLDAAKKLQQKYCVNRRLHQKTSPSARETFTRRIRRETRAQIWVHQSPEKGGHACPQAAAETPK